MKHLRMMLHDLANPFEQRQMPYHDKSFLVHCFCLEDCTWGTICSCGRSQHNSISASSKLNNVTEFLRPPSAMIFAVRSDLCIGVLFQALEHRAPFVLCSKILPLNITSNTISAPISQIIKTLQGCYVACHNMNIWQNFSNLLNCFFIKT